MSSALLRSFGFCVVIVALATTTGCNEVRGRRKIQEGNRLYRDGMYKEAVSAFTDAEQMVPNFWVLWLNKGHTCKQMIIPGAKTPENMAAANCALAAFKRMQELKPDDPRGELLYFQTLFDADKFEELAQIYEKRFQKNPRDMEAVTGLIQVYTKSNKMDEALEWYAKKAEIQANDPETQYTVGVYIWNQLMVHGGGADKASFDPRLDPNKPKKKQIKIPPPYGAGDIVSQQRIDLADKGIEYLKKALQLRPTYADAMIYIGLLNRQKAYAFFDQPDEWQKCMNEAVEYQRRYLTALGKPIPDSLKAVAPPGAHGDDEEGASGGEDKAAADTGKKKGKGSKGSRKRKRGKR
jgi:tetratricopeptide (TPR) repeat protein